MWVGYPGGGKNAWNPRGFIAPNPRKVRGVPGGGKNAWNPRGIIAPNPRKVRGVHELRGNGFVLTGYHY